MNNWMIFTPEDRVKIRKAYKPLMEDIKAGKRRDVYAIWPHDWHLYMSPIERNVWQDIRSMGLPLYPQVPCGKYFIDFADPAQGIAIEVDGKEWHQDIEKDRRREDYLRLNGYPYILRLLGSTTFGDIDYERWADNDDEYEPDEYLAESLLATLSEYYRGKSLSPFLS